MAGDELRVALEVETGFRLQHADRGDRHRHQRRLRVLGQRQGFDRTFEDNGRQLAAERLVDFIEHLPGRREIRRQGLAHANRLAALAGKYESCRHWPSLCLNCVKIGPKDTSLVVSVKFRSPG